MATLMVRYKWGRKVFEVDARDGATLGVDTRVSARKAERASARGRVDGPRMGMSPSVPEILGDAGVPTRVEAIEVQAVWFGDSLVSRPYGPHELDGVRDSEDRWCQFLHDNEGVEAMTLNGETVWQSADSRKSTALDDVLDALRG